MKKEYSHITFVLDNSGSMYRLTHDTIGGYNSFIKKQKEVPGVATFSLYQFNNTPNEKNPHNYVTTYEYCNLYDVPDLNDHSYQCLSRTPLLDTIGHALDITGQKIAAMKEFDRPEKVIFVILTDGKENASTRYTRAKINEMIKHQTDVYKWQFIFSAANQDAIAAGGDIGIASGRAVNFAVTGMSTKSSYDAISDSVSFLRTASVSDASAYEIDSNTKQQIFDGTYKS